MKYSIFIGALLVIFLTGSAAQTSAQRITFSESIDTAGRNFGKATFVGSYRPNLRLYEADVIGPVGTCFDNTQFSQPRLAAQGSAGWDWRINASRYEVKWIVPPDTGNSCRVLFLSSDDQVDSSDYIIWRKRYGSGSVGEASLTGSLGLADWWVGAPLPPPPPPPTPK